MQRIRDYFIHQLLLSSLLLLPVTTLYADEPLQKYTLPNGLKIVVKEDHRAPVAVSMIWYNVGSADEPGGITGVSHALEHMMFKGTSQYPAGVFSKTIAALGGQDNAFTNYDYTAYFEKIAASQLPVALELEADRMHNLLLDNKEFKPNAALLLPVVLLYKACKPTALLPYPIVLEFKAA